jgi:pimeloyl-ACP methyl ester carboxylesterase
MTTTASIHLGSFTRRVVCAAGFDVAYYEAGHGTPLVVLPGAGGPNLGPAYDLLAEQFRVIMIELPGWGATPNDVADFDGLADQVVATIDTIGLDTFHLLGTSLGGACALHLVSRYPTRVISLTLEAPAKLRTDSVNPADLPPDQVVSAFRTHPERGLPMAPLDPEFMDRVWPTVMRLMGDGTLDAAFERRLTAIETRTLVMFGQNDGVINPINGRTYRRLMPNCVLMYVYDAAHEIAQDRPEAFVDVVSDFIRRGMNFIVNDHDRLINP